MECEELIVVNTLFKYDVIIFNPEVIYSHFSIIVVSKNKMTIILLLKNGNTLYCEVYLALYDDITVLTFAVVYYGQC